MPWHEGDSPARHAILPFNKTILSQLHRLGSNALAYILERMANDTYRVVNLHNTLGHQGMGSSTRTSSAQWSSTILMYSCTIFVSIFACPWLHIPTSPIQIICSFASLMWWWSLLPHMRI